MTPEIKTDVAIIGGGPLGLNAARQLSREGYGVFVAEAADTLAFGPGTRNGRVLWSGSYHLGAIQNEDEAVNVAKRLQEGSREIRGYVPRAIGDRGQKTFALIHESEGRDRILDRWQKAGLPFTGVLPKQFRVENPSVSTGEFVFAAEVPERSFDVAQYYAKLAAEAVDNGAVIVTNAEFTPGGEMDRDTSVVINDQEYKLTAERYLVTAGYNAAPLYEAVTGEPLGMRYWKGQFIIVPRQTHHNIIPTGPGQLSVMNFGDVSYVGKNQSTQEVAVPNFDVNEDVTHALLNTAGSLFNNFRRDIYHPHACITPGILLPGQEYYPVDEHTREHGLYAFAWPGKVTNAPVAARELVAETMRAFESIPKSGVVYISHNVRTTSPGITPYPYENTMTMS